MIHPIKSPHLRYPYQTVTILLVEDDDLDAIAIERVFKRIKVTNPLIRAKNGEEAINILKSKIVKDPMIVLLDLNMPRMNGLEFLSAVRTDPELTHLIIFVLTTSEDEKDILQAFQKHIAGYLLKQHMDQEFLSFANFLDSYWRLVELPVVRR